MSKAGKTREYDFSNAKRGAIVPSRNKERITIRLDADIIKWFRKKVHKAGGGNYQSYINRALQDYIQQEQGASLEDTLRKVIREELRTEDRAAM